MAIYTELITFYWLAFNAHNQILIIWDRKKFIAKIGQISFRIPIFGADGSEFKSRADHVHIV